MIRSKPRIVLFLPHRTDPRRNVRASADLLPLELLQIAGIPDQHGYEIVLVDAMIHPDYLERLFEACDGALLFASSCILGYQVAHGAEVARAIRARFPHLPIIWGGWFPSVYPEGYLRENVADAVAIGQGEFTFWDVVQALDNGEDLEQVAGLVLQREGQIIQTPQRPVVGFDNIPDVPWHLLDFEPYVDLQNLDDGLKIRHHYPRPRALEDGAQLRGFSHYSSYGCPEPCTFCCSPQITNRRWKAIPGPILAERTLEAHDRFKFNVLRFHDANFGVAEKRSNEYCDAMIAADREIYWTGNYEIETIARYKESSVDKLRDAKCYLVTMGAESGSKEQQERILKKIKLDTNVETALGRLYNRGIQTGCTWIIGYPGETQDSMRQTLAMAAEMKHKFPRSASDIFPFRPIPGSDDYDLALKAGFKPPETLDEWGSILEYKVEYDDIGLPEDVVRTWQRYGVTATLYDGLVKEGADSVRNMVRKISGWRLRTGNYRFPIEQKLFHVYLQLIGKRDTEVYIKRDRTSGVTPNPPGVN